MVTTAVTGCRPHEVRPARGNTTCGWLPSGFQAGSPIEAGFERAGIPAERARSLAMLVESALEGLMVIARATADARPLDAVVEELASLLDDAVCGRA